MYTKEWLLNLIEEVNKAKIDLANTIDKTENNGELIKIVNICLEKTYTLHHKSKKSIEEEIKSQLIYILPVVITKILGNLELPDFNALKMTIKAMVAGSLEELIQRLTATIEQAEELGLFDPDKVVH